MRDQWKGLQGPATTLWAQDAVQLEEAANARALDWAVRSSAYDATPSTALVRNLA